MNKFFLFSIVILLNSCIGPVKELESQIQDIYFNSVTDNPPEPLPESFDNKVKVTQSWNKAFDDLPLNVEIAFKDEFFYLISQDGVFYKIDQESSDIIFTKKLNTGVDKGLFFK